MLTYPIRFVLVNRHGRWREQWRGSLRGRSVSLLCRWWVFVDKVGWWQKGEENNSTNCFLVSTRSVGETVMLSLTWWGGGGSCQKSQNRNKPPLPEKKLELIMEDLETSVQNTYHPPPYPHPRSELLIEDFVSGTVCGDYHCILRRYRLGHILLLCIVLHERETSDDWRDHSIFGYVTVKSDFGFVTKSHCTIDELTSDCQSWRILVVRDDLNYKSVFHWIVILYILMKASDFVIISVSILKFHFAYVNSSYEGLFRWCTWSCMFGISRHTGSVNFAVGVLEIAIQKFSNFRPWVSTFQTCYKASFDD